MRSDKSIYLYMSGLIALLAPFCVIAQQVVVSDTLTGASSSVAWQTFGDACLTAGDGSPSTIPACTATNKSGYAHVGGVSGVLPDPIGQGALRLTNGGNDIQRTGQIVSTSPFNTTQGVQVTFTTVTYGGNGLNGTGADGMAFFLIDGSYLTPRTSDMVLGSAGGSLGYSCANNRTDSHGTNGGYLAVAMDEFGNFPNPADNGSAGPGFTPGAVTVKGAGSVYYPSLSALYPNYYPACPGYPNCSGSISLANVQQGIRNTCSSGYYQQWNGYSWQSTGIPAPDYKILKNPTLLSTKIYSQEGVAKPLRSLATPITYDLKITSQGILSLNYSVNGGPSSALITNQNIQVSNGAVPSTLLFGFTAGTGGGSNVHEITCFKAAPINSAGDSAGSNAQQAAKVQVGSQIYLAYYHPLNSWGQLQAISLLSDSKGNITISSTPNWDAHCVLTGCSSGATPATAQDPTTRTILSSIPTSSGATGIPFQYGSLSATLANAIGGAGSGTDTGANRVSFIRGDRTNEVNAAGVGPYRIRTGVLGDIMASSPIWVGAPTVPNVIPTTDALYSKVLPGYSSYSTFATKYAARTSIVYVGANDGMLHGFRAGNPNDGKELIAYVPNAVVNSIHSSNVTLDYSSPSYAHNSYIDATPGTGSLFYANAWHTWVVGGLGAGGNANGTINDVVSTGNGVLYALDVTDPTTFAESNAAKLVIGEWSSSNISCVNDANCKTKLGNIFGTPVVRTLHDGNFAVIFGNGRNSANGTAGIFVMSVNSGTGAITFNYFDTNSGSASNMNWIDFVTPADLDSDGVVDYVYAGDAYGQVWRLDLTSNDPTKWAMGPKLFTTPSGQPITTKILVTSSQQAKGNNRIILNFGTGVQYPQTLSSASTYASGTQALYGIWDWNMSAWNKLGSFSYASLSGSQNFTASDLQTQTISSYSGGTGGVSGYRTVTQNPVCWSGSTTCSSSNNQFGWKMSLPGAGEQIIYNPVIQNGGLFVNTTIPAVNQVLSCSTQPASGFTMALAPDTGGAPVASYFSTAALNAGIPVPSGAVIAGLGLSGTGTPTFVTSTGSSSNNSGSSGSTGSISQQSMVQQNTSGTGSATTIDQAGSSTGKRMTWVKLR